MVACYGWTKELFEEAKKRGVVPIISAGLERELKNAESLILGYLSVQQVIENQF
jgi:hypothetical protein